MPKKCQSDLHTLLLAGAGLVAFGIGYNSIVGWMERKGYERGVTSLLVVVGVGVTLIPLWPLYGLKVLFDAIILFVCSGTPMIAGSLFRYIEERQQEQAQLYIATKNDN